MIVLLLMFIEINIKERFQKCKQVFQLIHLFEENKMVCLAKFENSKPGENWGRKAKGLK